MIDSDVAHPPYPQLHDLSVLIGDASFSIEAVTRETVSLALSKGEEVHLLAVSVSFIHLNTAANKCSASFQSTCLYRLYAKKNSPFYTVSYANRAPYTLHKVYQMEEIISLTRGEIEQVMQFTHHLKATVVKH